MFECLYFESMKKLLLLAAMSVSTALTLRSQTIVNTHDLMSPIDSIWATNIEIQGSVSTGNGVFTAFNSGVGLGRKLSSKSQVWALGGYNYASESGNLIYQTGFLNARYHYALSTSKNLQFFYQRQFNSALKINLRQLIGLNLGYTVSIRGYNLSSSIGIFDENETYTEEPFQHIQRLNLSLNMTKSVGDVEVNLTLYHQPSLQLLSDYRTLGELAIELPINQSVNLEIESALRYDSDPHLNLVPIDFSTLIGMSFNL